MGCIRILSEHKADTVLGMRGEERVIAEDAETQAEGEFLDPVLADGPSESVCRGQADLGAVTGSVGTETEGDEVGRIIVCAPAHFHSSLDA